MVSAETFAGRRRCATGSARLCFFALHFARSESDQSSKPHFQPTIALCQAQAPPKSSWKAKRPKPAKRQQQMCRLFGFRSVIPSQVHRSLIAADNALAKQSLRHPDGWGVAYYAEGSPHVTKSAATAMDDALFRRVSGVVSSETVVAHIRKATQGTLTVLNSHPFQYGRWVLAHNGDIPNLEKCRGELEEAIAPRLRRFILGDTDSERIFFMFLTQLSMYGDLSSPTIGLQEVVPALRATVSMVRRIADKDVPESDLRVTIPGKRSLLTLLVTNGITMAAHQGGKELHYSTYKRRCGDRDVCPSLSTSCEAPVANGEKVNHLVIASEVLQGENVWVELEEDDIVGVDWRMSLFIDRPGQKANGDVNASNGASACLNW